MACGVDWVWRLALHQNQVWSGIAGDMGAANTGAQNADIVPGVHYQPGHSTSSSTANSGHCADRQHRHGKHKLVEIYPGFNSTFRFAFPSRHPHTHTLPPSLSMASTTAYTDLVLYLYPASDLESLAPHSLDPFFPLVDIKYCCNIPNVILLPSKEILSRACDHRAEQNRLTVASNAFGRCMYALQDLWSPYASGPNVQAPLGRMKTVAGLGGWLETRTVANQRS
jgi:hypothetical protein